MPREFTPKVVTANRLLEGDAVWFTAADTWSTSIRDAELLTDEAHADLRLLEAQAQRNIIAGAYLADAKQTPDGPDAVHFREDFRTRGPSNYVHGKQEQSHV